MKHHEERQQPIRNERLPEMRPPRDEIAEMGRLLRTRREDANLPSDLKYWR